MFIPLKILTKKLRKLSLSKSIGKTKLIYNITGNYPFDKEIIEFDRIFPLKKITFERKSYACSNGYDYYLKHLYGDYMKLPSKDKKIPMICYILNLKIEKKLIFKKGLTNI